MSCRIGISTDPEERIDHWKEKEGYTSSFLLKVKGSEHSWIPYSGGNPAVYGSGFTKRVAQDWEMHLQEERDVYLHLAAQIPMKLGTYTSSRNRPRD